MLGLHLFKRLDKLLNREMLKLSSIWVRCTSLEGVAKEPKEAAQWYRKAAERGHEKALRPVSEIIKEIYEDQAPDRIGNSRTHYQLFTSICLSV